MRRFIARVLVNALGLWIASVIIAGMEIMGIGTLLAAALLLSIVNAVLRPIFIVLTLPITILTLGLFLVVVNTAILSLVAWFLPGFVFRGFFSALGATVIVSVVNWLVSWYNGRGRRAY